jgi:hypothetical protein
MSEDVPIGDDFLTVYGISARDGLRILQQFPQVATMVDKGFNLGSFLAVAPDAVAAIIATATGCAGDEKSEENAGRLGIETQFNILEAIGRLTFTNGFAPFVARIMALADAVPSAPSTKAPAMKSPPVSKPSSPEDISLM